MLNIIEIFPKMTHIHIRLKKNMTNNSTRRHNMKNYMYNFVSFHIFGESMFPNRQMKCCLRTDGRTDEHSVTLREAHRVVLYIYIIYTQSLHQLNLPSSKTCHTRVPRGYQIKTKISNFGYLHILSAHILIWNLQILRMSK